MTLAATLACASVTTEPDLARQHLVDTAAIQIDDLETPAERFEDLSQTGQMAEFVDDQAGYGFVVPSLGKGDAELARHFVHGHPSRQKPGTVRAPHRLRLGLALVRPERSCNRVQNVGRGHYSLEVTIFVVNEGHRRLGFAQDVQDVEGVDRVGDNGRLPYMGADVDGFSVQEGSQEIAYLHHADQFVGAGFADRKSDIAIYIVAGFEDSEALIAKLGKCKTTKSCLYVKRLADIDPGVLEALVSRSVAEMRRRYP